MARTPNERITALEIYNEMVREDMGEIRTFMEKIEARLDKIEETQQKDKAEFDQMKNRGMGLLVGVALAAGGAGAAGAALWRWLTGG